MLLLTTFCELKETHCFMKPGKAAGPDIVSLEFFSHGRLEMKNRLMLLIYKILEDKKSPYGLKNANIVTIFKKGETIVASPS